MLVFTPTAVTAARQAVETADEPAVGLRISAQPGGCHGPRCSMVLEEEGRDGDTTFDFEGVTVFVDADSLPLLKGVTVDFVTNERGAVFVLDNPAWRKRGSGGCGCGGH